MNEDDAWADGKPDEIEDRFDARAARADPRVAEPCGPPPSPLAAASAIPEYPSEMPIGLDGYKTYNRFI
jgi:hypothetical protein